MLKGYGRQDFQLGKGDRHVITILLWIALITGLVVSIFSLVEELCLSTACKDTASFTIFGVGMGWFGIAFFCFVLILLWLNKKVYGLDWVLAAIIFAGIGAEFRLLWIQKYIIGSWCPLCVTICCTMFSAGILMLVERVHLAGSVRGRGKSLSVWITFMAAMIAAGLTIAILGVKALS